MLKRSRNTVFLAAYLTLAVSLVFGVALMAIEYPSLLLRGVEDEVLHAVGLGVVEDGFALFVFGENVRSGVEEDRYYCFRVAIVPSRHH